MPTSTPCAYASPWHVGLGVWVCFASRSEPEAVEGIGSFRQLSVLCGLNVAPEFRL